MTPVRRRILARFVLALAARALYLATAGPVPPQDTAAYAATAPHLLAGAGSVGRAHRFGPEGRACWPPRIGCVGVECFDQGFTPKPVRTLWTQNGIE